VCTLLILASLSLVSANSITEYGKTSFDSEISIVKPNAHVYIFNIQIAPLPGQGRFNAIVIGMVNVQVDVGNTSVDKVEFYVDNELKENDTEAPYEWMWDERMIVPPIHSLKVVGYDNDVEVGSDEIRLLYINPFLFRP
ncbi:MAG: hypothetical protein JSW06_03855, partial [Thermoplasmatales archaeon]